MQPITFVDRATGETINENPPGEGFLKFLYHNPFGQLSLELLVKRKLLSSLYGRLMDGPGSAKRIQPFVDSYGINMDEATKKVADYTSFNDFFYRKLKPEARLIGEGFVSPADGKLLAFETIKDVDEYYVKGSKFTLKEYLQDDALAAKYEGGSMLLVRLAPNDYHRFHFPYAGTPAESVAINGAYYSVSPYAVQPNFAKVFCENKRAYTILATEDKGDVLVSPVGATMVGGILHTYEPNVAIEKGGEMGYFAFGGSSLLLLMEPGAVKLDADLLENTRAMKETAVVMGEQIGI